MSKGAMMGREWLGPGGGACKSHWTWGRRWNGSSPGSDSNLLSDTGQVTRPPWFQFSHL